MRVQVNGHWTNTKIRVHAFYCVLALLLASVLHRKVRRAGISADLDSLLNTLSRMRVVLGPPKSGARLTRKTAEQHRRQNVRCASTGPLCGGKGVAPHISAELAMCTGLTVRFAQPHGGRASYGYPATVIVDICDGVLAVREAGAFDERQMHIADQTQLLVRGLAQVGIVALFDEAAGYQQARGRDAL